MFDHLNIRIWFGCLQSTAPDSRPLQNLFHSSKTIFKNRDEKVGGNVEIIHPNNTHLKTVTSGEETVDFFKTSFDLSVRESAAIMGAHTFGRWLFSCLVSFEETHICLRFAVLWGKLASSIKKMFKSKDECPSHTVPIWLDLPQYAPLQQPLLQVWEKNLLIFTFGMVFNNNNCKRKTKFLSLKSDFEIRFQSHGRSGTWSPRFHPSFSSWQLALRST